jgi:hypothetical protein
LRFSPETVDRIGTAWVDEVDVWRHERLDDGALLVVTTRTPDVYGQHFDLDTLTPYIGTE